MAKVKMKFVRMQDFVAFKVGKMESTRDYFRAVQDGVDITLDEEMKRYTFERDGEEIVTDEANVKYAIRASKADLEAIAADRKARNPPKSAA